MPGLYKYSVECIVAEGCVCVYAVVRVSVAVSLSVILVSLPVIILIVALFVFYCFLVKSDLANYLLCNSCCLLH